jgi:hypothetical protein
MLASYVVLQNHLPMMADYPSAYRSHPLTRVMASVPATWDDTRALIARVGEEVVVARRGGNDWWIGAMTDSRSREVRVPLSFLQPGLYQAEIYRDDLAAEHGFKRETRKVQPPDELSLPLAAAGGALVKLTLIPEPAPKWRLVSSDDFDTFDKSKWERREDKLVSRLAQRFGRWEVRARLKGGQGASSMIRLQPDAPFPAAGAIDIMVNRDDRPTITSSAFHWPAKNPAGHDSFAVEQRMAIGGRLVSYADSYHTFACEWVENQLRFYVDDVHHGTFYSDEVGYFLPQLTMPMRLLIDAADVDWVRIYELAEGPGTRTFRNGGFDEGGGSAAGWHIFGNHIDDSPNVLVQREVVRDGAYSLKIAGQSIGEANFSGVTQSISVAAGERVRAKLAAFVRSQEDLVDPQDGVWMKIEFYNHWGDYFGGPALLGFEERAIADAVTPTDIWREHELEAVAPVGAVEARLSLSFGQAGNEPGAIYIDAVELSPSK